MTRLGCIANSSAAHRSSVSWRNFPVRTSTPIIPTTCAASTSLVRSSPIMYISSGSTPRRLAAARKPSGAGLPTAVALRPEVSSIPIRYLPVSTRNPSVVVHGLLRRLRPGEIARVRDVDAGHVLADLAAVDQKAPRVRIAVADVLRGEHRSGDDLVCSYLHACLGEQLGDLHTGARRGVRQIRARNLVARHHLQSFGRTLDRLPRRHQDAVDVEQHTADSHGPTVTANDSAQLGG